MVAELLRWQVPAAVILLCLLLGFHQRLPHEQDGLLCGLLLACFWLSEEGLLGILICNGQENDFFEIFSGTAHVSGALRDVPWLVKDMLQ